MCEIVVEELTRAVISIIIALVIICALTFLCSNNNFNPFSLITLGYIASYFISKFNLQ